MKEVKIALLGAGTVGSKVAQILQAQNEELSARAGAKLRLSGVAVRDAAKTREGIDPALLSTDIDAVSHAQSPQSGENRGDWEQGSVGGTRARTL